MKTIKEINIEGKWAILLTDAKRYDEKCPTEYVEKNIDTVMTADTYEEFCEKFYALVDEYEESDVRYYVVHNGNVLYSGPISSDDQEYYDEYYDNICCNLDEEDE